MTWDKPNVNTHLLQVNIWYHCSWVQRPLQLLILLFLTIVKRGAKKYSDIRLCWTQYKLHLRQQPPQARFNIVSIILPIFLYFRCELRLPVSRGVRLLPAPHWVQPLLRLRVRRPPAGVLHRSEPGSRMKSSLQRLMSWLMDRPYNFPKNQSVV